MAMTPRPLGKTVRRNATGEPKNDRLLDASMNVADAAMYRIKKTASARI